MNGGIVDAIARALTGDLPQDRAIFVGVDGVDGSGKTTFATALRERVVGRPSLVIHLDDFLHPRPIRHARGRDSPEGFWLDTYDYSAFQRVLSDPAAAGSNAVIIVEGMFLHRDELVGLWDYSVFLDVPFPETARRMALRDGSHPDPNHESMNRYIGGQRLYFANARPWERATTVIDNSDPANPRRIEPAKATASDSCGA